MTPVSALRKELNSGEVRAGQAVVQEDLQAANVEGGRCSIANSLGLLRLASKRRCRSTGLARPAEFDPTS